MARSGDYSTFWFDGDDTAWVLRGTVTFGRPGTYFDPPDGDDVEIHGAEEELDRGFHGPCRKLSFDDFVAAVGASDADVEEMKDKLAAEAAEFDGDDEPREPDLDDVHPEFHDSLDRYDMEY